MCELHWHQLRFLKNLDRVEYARQFIHVGKHTATTGFMHRSPYFPYLPTHSSTSFATSFGHSSGKK